MSRAIGVKRVSFPRDKEESLSREEVRRMPFGDRTGPMGWGPMTGRGAGYCAGYPVPGFMDPPPGRGFWGWGRGFWGRGGGRGWRHCYYATGLPGWARAGAGAPAWGMPVDPHLAPFGPPLTSEQQTEILKGQAEYFEGALEEIRKRIEELERQPREKA